MKTTINRHRVGTIKEFADEFGLEMVVNEKPFNADSDKRFKAKFLNCRSRVGLTGGDDNFGFGNTPEVAMEDLAKRITCQTLTVYSDDSYSSDNKQIPVWRLDEKPAEPSDEERIAVALKKGVDAGNATIKHMAETFAKVQPEIAACPVCGAEPFIKRIVYNYRVTCSVRCICGPVCLTEAKAIAVWNKLAGSE